MPAWLAQLLEHETFNLRVLGSIPTVGVISQTGVRLKKRFHSLPENEKHFDVFLFLDLVDLSFPSRTCFSKAWN